MRPLAALLTPLGLALLLALGTTGVPATPANAAAAAVEPLPEGTDVDYQLGGPASRPTHVGIIARDRRASPVAGRYNICYVNGFQTQPDEKAFWLKRRGLLLKKNGKPVVDENWGEWLLDVRTAKKRTRLARIVGRWIDGCARDGFQGVEFDNLDSFSRSRGLLKRKQTLFFARMLIRRAHRAGLAAGQKNLAGFDGTGIGFDFAVAEECGQYHECRSYVRHFGTQVVMIEYRDAGFRRACRQFGATHAIVRRDLDLRPSFMPRYCVRAGVATLGD